MKKMLLSEEKYNDDLILVNAKNPYCEEEKQLDKFKMAAAFLVAAIHTSPLASLSGEADFIFTRVIARTAVPFFLMVTGYFLLPQYLFGRSMDKRPLRRALEKHLLLYLAAILLYLPVNLYAGQFKALSAGGFLRLLLADGTFYHLWYLPAAVFGILIVWFLGRRLPFGVLTVVSLVLYVVGLFGDSYYGLTEQVPFLRRIYDVIFSISSYTRNGLFYAPFFLAMGAGMGMRGTKEAEYGSQSAVEETQNAVNVKNSLGLLECLTLMIMEGLLLHKNNLQRHDSMYLMLPPVMFFLFRLLLAENLSEKERRREPADRLCGGDISPERTARRCRKGKKLREISTYIYLIHPLCIILVRGAAKAAGMESLFVDNSMLHYLAVCTIACAGACILGLATEKFRMRKSVFDKSSFFGEGEGVLREKVIFGMRKKNFEKGRAWIELSRENLAKNVEVLQTFLSPGQQLMPALKANAYGHGAVLIAGELQRLGIDAFCVACAAEGKELRENGITGDILILGYTHPEDFPMLRKYRLTQTVVDCNYGKILDHWARHGKKLRVQVKIDTGMHRLGERAESTKEIGRIFRLKNLKVEGIYTHLCADETRTPGDMVFTQRQAELFYEAVEKIGKRGYTDLKVHLLASYGLFNYPELGGDFVRVGIALYGLLSDRGTEGMKALEEDEKFGAGERPGEGKWEPGENSMKNCRAALVPVLSLRVRIAAVKDVYPGESVGYGAAYVAKDRRKIAVLAIGYGDGLPRGLSDGVGRVLIHGQSAPVVGRICMDQMMVDITGIAEVKPGEIATVIGRDGGQEITAYELAEKTGTITNEILAEWG